MTEENKKLLADIVAKYKELQPLIKEAQEILLKERQAWPKSKPDNQLLKNMSKWEIMFDALNRASNISLNTINKKVLLIGCNDPYLPDHYASEADLVVSYNRKTNWPDFYNRKNNLIFTDNLEEVVPRAPYDLIIYWDILDHYFEDYITPRYDLSERLDENQQHLLEIGKSLLFPHSKMFIRCHPWFSRQGGHLNDNIAYNHLFIKDEEYLGLLDDDNLITHRIYDPVAYYRRLVNLINPSIIESHIIENKPEPEIADMLLIHVRPTWPVNISDEQLLSILSTEYIDFMLTF